MLMLRARRRHTFSARDLFFFSSPSQTLPVKAAGAVVAAAASHRGIFPFFFMSRALTEQTNKTKQKKAPVQAAIQVK